MPEYQKKDNASFKEKVLLRLQVLRELQEPFVMEAFCGRGVLYDRLYRAFAGCAVDKEEDRVTRAARERGRWITVCGDSGKLLQAGLLASVEIPYFDLDAYGSPLSCVRGVLSPDRARPAKTWIVATDGNVYHLQRSSALLEVQPYIIQHGESYVRQNYDVILHEWLTERCNEANLDMTFWKYYRTGSGNRLSHWTIRVERRPVTL